MDFNSFLQDYKKKYKDILPESLLNNDYVLSHKFVIVRILYNIDKLFKKIELLENYIIEMKTKVSLHIKSITTQIEEKSINIDNVNDSIYGYLVNNIDNVISLCNNENDNLYITQGFNKEELIQFMNDLKYSLLRIYHQNKSETNINFLNDFPFNEETETKEDWFSFIDNPDLLSKWEKDYLYSSEESLLWTEDNSLWDEDINIRKEKIENWFNDISNSKSQGMFRYILKDYFNKWNEHLNLTNENNVLNMVIEDNKEKLEDLFSDLSVLNDKIYDYEFYLLSLNDFVDEVLPLINEYETLVLSELNNGRQVSTQKNTITSLDIKKIIFAFYLTAINKYKSFHNPIKTASDSIVQTVSNEIIPNLLSSKLNFEKALKQNIKDFSSSKFLFIKEKVKDYYGNEFIKCVNSSDSIFIATEGVFVNNTFYKRMPLISIYQPYFFNKFEIYRKYKIDFLSEDVSKMTNVLSNSYQTIGEILFIKTNKWMTKQFVGTNFDPKSLTCLTFDIFTNKKTRKYIPSLFKGYFDELPKIKISKRTGKMFLYFLDQNEKEVLFNGFLCVDKNKNINLYREVSICSFIDTMITGTSNESWFYSVRGFSKKEITEEFPIYNNKSELLSNIKNIRKIQPELFNIDNKLHYRGIYDICSSLSKSVSITI